jgi:hypothetical protein
MDLNGMLAVAVIGVGAIAIAAWFCYAVHKVQEELELFAGFEGMHFEDR